MDTYVAAFLDGIWKVEQKVHTISTHPASSLVIVPVSDGCRYFFHLCFDVLAEVKLRKHHLRIISYYPLLSCSIKAHLCSQGHRELEPPSPAPASQIVYCLQNRCRLLRQGASEHA